MALLQGLGHLLGIYDSPARAQAEADAQQALAAAQNQNDLVKQMVLNNQAIAGGLGDQWFGQDPNAVAQQIADKRVADANTKLDRRGMGNSSPSQSGGGAAAQPKLMPGWQMATPPPDNGTYKINGQPVSYADYLKAWQQSQKTTNPDNRPLIADPQTKQWRTVTDAELQQASKLGYDTGLGSDGKQTSATTHATITDADRAAAAKQAQDNYGNTLPGELDASLGRRQSATDAFTNAINGIQGVDAGNYDNNWNVDANKQYVSDAAKNAQKTAMDKTLALTDTKETAAEKLMREMSRREQEQTLRSQSEAQANQLRSRGAYGSGAEVAGFLGNQQETAQRRSLEEMQANANAQQRAMQALSTYGNQSFQLGQQDQASGALQDANARFNSQSQQQWKQFQTKTQQQENDAAAKRAASKLDATNQVENVTRGDVAQVADRQAQVAGLKTGANTNGAELSGQATGLISGAYNTDAANKTAKANDDESITSGLL